MKKRLGISIYPEFSKESENIKYIETAAKHGFNLLFLAFLSLKDDRETIIKRYKPITDYAKKLGYEIICDVNPTVLDKLGVNISMFKGKLDLSFFTDLNIDVMRLDVGMSEIEEAFLSNNSSGIKICMNAYMAYDHIGSFLTAGGNPEAVIGCHNYYPHRYTGISYDHFVKGSMNYVNHNIRLQSFVSSQSEEAFGPYPITEGLPTLEMHRNWKIETQIKHYIMTGLVDDILIGNCFATEDELKRASEANTEKVTFNINLVDGLPENMAEHLNMDILSRRQDENDYLIRTLESRLFTSGEIKPFNTVDIHRGDVLIENCLYGQYAGEISIALQEMKNSGKTNVVGHLLPEEVELLPYLKGGQQFCFKFE